MFFTTKLALLALVTLALTCSPFTLASQDQVVPRRLRTEGLTSKYGGITNNIINSVLSNHESGDVGARTNLVHAALEELVVETIAAVRTKVDEALAELVNETITAHKGEISASASDNGVALGNHTIGGHND